MNTPLPFDELLPKIVNLTHQAGLAVMKFYAQEELGTIYKDGDSPLTLADVASHQYILEHLGALTPQVPVLSEESQAAPHDVRRTWRTFWLVDPLDGTKEFIQRNGEFTVNIALVEAGRPVLGVVHAPAMDLTYFAAAGVGAFKQNAQNGISPISAAEYDPSLLKIVVSRSHPSHELNAFLERIGCGFECVPMGSSLKICLVADGAAHLYPRLGPTMEWDTAAAQCVVEMAGGAMTDLDGHPLTYNKPNLHNPPFMVCGRPGFEWKTYLEANHGGPKPRSTAA
jgi:3'(2'), 5'-bisphosphate nucleotidase